VPVEVHVVTPEREVWSGTAEMLIARGVDGELGILGGHAPMMVQLAIGPLRILTEGEGEVAAVVDGGFLHVTSAADGADEGGGGTRVDVLASGAELAGDIDIDAARQRADDLRERLQDQGSRLAEAEIAALQAELQKALARASLAG
jgi:F-type H+-transporting ATPase subunit epsilon